MQSCTQNCLNHSFRQHGNCHLFPMLCGCVAFAAMSRRKPFVGEDAEIGWVDVRISWILGRPTPTHLLSLPENNNETTHRDERPGWHKPELQQVTFVIQKYWVCVLLQRKVRCGKVNGREMNLQLGFPCTKPAATAWRCSPRWRARCCRRGTITFLSVSGSCFGNVLLPCNTWGQTQALTGCTYIITHWSHRALHYTLVFTSSSFQTILKNHSQATPPLLHKREVWRFKDRPSIASAGTTQRCNATHYETDYVTIYNAI